MIAKNPLITCIPFLLFIFSCYSCTSGKVTDSVLLRADSLMECCADSALALLENIEYPQEMKRSERAFYGLLLTKARDKCLVEHTSDSIMKLVVAYYQQHGSTYQKMESLYYLASVYRDLGDAPRALDYFGRAADASKDQTEYRLLGLIYSQMGTLFFYQNLHEEGVAAYRQSYQYDLLLGDSLTLPYGLSEMARIHTELGNVDSTLYYYNEAIELAQKIGKFELAKEIQIELADIYLQLEDYEEARKYLDKKNAADYLNWGELYSKTELLDSARYYYLKALNDRNLYIKKRTNQELYSLEKSLGQTEIALHYLEQYVHCQDSIQRITDIEGVKRVQSLYKYQHIENENSQLLLENRTKRYIMYIVLVVSVLIISSGWWLFLYYRREKDMQMEQNQRMFFFKQQESQAEVEKKEQEIVRLKQRLESTSIKSTQEIDFLQKQIEEITQERDKLLEQKQQSEDAFRSSSIYLLLHASCKNPNFNMKEYWDELQEQIDKSYNNLTNRLYVLCPKLSETELRVSLLIKAEISLKDIARLLHKEKNSITNIRKRLYEKVYGESGKADQWDSFIKEL